MRKLNNKGFAISTILYSLLIMVFLIVILLMGIMSSNRINTKNLVKTIEEELNRYSLTSTEFSSSSSGTNVDAQEFIVPYSKAGWYRIELWGASGADATARGGGGAYTSGVIYLEENTALYFYIGSKGNGTTGGSNGGGNGNGNGHGGGGATDVRLSAGNWNDIASLNNRIMVAAGGSGASGNISGENGGTLEAGISTNATYGKGATQTTGGAAGSGASVGVLGLGGNGTSNGSGGGGGYYGGGGGGAASPGGGGSSYIRGYAGAGSPGTSYDVFNFINGRMSENANNGNGKAKIELISMNDKNNPPAKKNTKLNNVRYIKDCLTSIGASGTTPPQWLEIQTIQNGKNIAYGKAGGLTDGNRSTPLPGNSEANCSLVDLGSVQNLDELAVWHIPTILADASDANNRVLNGHTLSVSSNGSTWATIKTTAGETVTTSPEGAIGTHISAWDPDYNAALPDGTYYIFSSLYPNTSLITAQNSLIEDTDGDGVVTPNDSLRRVVGISPINGSELQKWVFAKNGSYYKIIERESNQAMQIADNKGQNGSNVNTSSAYNEAYQWADWEVISLGDGTYRIKPRIQPSTNPASQTYLSTNSKNWGVKNTSIILSTYEAGGFAQRFYLVNAE